jgi:hypothetical protein
MTRRSRVRNPAPLVRKAALPSRVRCHEPSPRPWGPSGEHLPSYSLHDRRRKGADATLAATSGRRNGHQSSGPVVVSRTWLRWVRGSRSDAAHHTELHEALGAAVAAFPQRAQGPAQGHRTVDLLQDRRRSTVPTTARSPANKRLLDRGVSSRRARLSVHCPTTQTLTRLHE